MCCSDAPDMSGVNAAAKINAEIAQEALNWYKQRYIDEAPARARAEERANEVADAQTEMMQFATSEAKDASEYNKTTFRPLEQRLVADAENYDTQGRRTQAAADAAADVDASFSGVEGAMARMAGRTGVGVDGGRALVLAQDQAIAQALGRAAAGTDAVRKVEQQGYARRMDAASLGRGLPGVQATQQQIATSAGNSAVGNAQTALGANMSGNATMQAGFNTGIQGATASGNLYSQAARIAAENSDDLLGGISQAAMGAASLGWKPFSSKKLKKNTDKAANPEKSLQAIERLDVKDGWEYDPAKGGPADGKKHTGPMAEQVQKELGDEASDGMTMDLIDINGHVIGAIQAMSKRIKRLEAHA